MREGPAELAAGLSTEVWAPILERVARRHPDYNDYALEIARLMWIFPRTVRITPVDYIEALFTLAKHAPFSQAFPRLPSA